MQLQKYEIMYHLTDQLSIQVTVILMHKLLMIYIIVKPVLSNHMKHDICLAFQTSGCLLLHESSAESNKYPPVYFHVT